MIILFVTGLHSLYNMRDSIYIILGTSGSEDNICFEMWDYLNIVKNLNISINLALFFDKAFLAEINFKCLIVSI